MGDKNTHRANIKNRDLLEGRLMVISNEIHAGIAWLKTQKSWVVKDENCECGAHHSRCWMGGQILGYTPELTLRVASTPARSIPLKKINNSVDLMKLNLVCRFNRLAVMRTPANAQRNRAMFAAFQPSHLPNNALGSQNPM